MSFKRAGNDLSMLHEQKKRRIDELFGPDIPSDEVSILNDGRYTCLVCNAVPILNSIEILKIHRNSKKHKEKFTRFSKQKQEKLLLVESRLQAAKHTGEDKTKLQQKKFELLNKPMLSTASKFKNRQPRLKLQLQSDECHHEKSFDSKKQLVLTSSNQQPTSLTRTGCLDKACSTVHAPGLEKMQKLSKLTESEKKGIHEDEIYRKSQGWLKDKDGNWVKDPNVEFDSDDET